MKRSFILTMTLLTAWAAPSQRLAAPGSFTISGTVMNAEGAPLAEADVSLSTTGAEGMQVGETVTGKDGEFRFSSLPAGKYALQASHRGYISAGYQQHGNFFTGIVTGPGLSSENLQLKLEPWAVIDGSITDDHGDAVPGAQVTLWGENRNLGTGRILRQKQQTTDESGTYEFAEIRTGTYYLSVMATPWYAFHAPPRDNSQGNELPSNQQSPSPLDVVYPLTFYQNATDSSGATPFEVHPGDRLQLNLSLHAIPAVHVRLQIPISSPPGHGIRMPAVVTNAFGSDEYVRAIENGGVIRDGILHAEIAGIAPGHYTLRSTGAEGGETSVSLDLTGNTEVSLPTASSGNTGLTGKLAMADGEPLPDHLSINLRIPEGNYVGGPATVAADGTFVFPSVSPGTYQLNVFSPTGTLPIVQMAASGAQIAGDSLTVAGEPVLMAATLARGSAEIRGFALRNGKGIGGVMIELIPDDPHASVQRYSRDQSDSDGSFTLQRVIPGNYTLVAIKDGWTLDWADHAAMAAYISHGVRVRVAVDQKTVNLPAAIEVQNR